MSLPLFPRGLVSLALLAFAVTCTGAQPVFNVRDFGAAGDGRTKDTAAIEKAIAACAQAGGGTVLFPKGIYLSGTIHLHGDNLTLRLEPEARLLAAPKGTQSFDHAEPNPFDAYQDYGHSHFRNALLYGTKLKNFAITGGGSIHGNDMTWSNNVPQATRTNSFRSPRRTGSRSQTSLCCKGGTSSCCSMIARTSKSPAASCALPAMGST